PTMEMETIRIEDLRRARAAGEDAPRRRSGPRNPEQQAPLRSEGPGVELPEGLPATKKQPILIDSELLLQWNEELERRRAAEEAAAASAAEAAGSVRDAGALSSRRLPRRWWAMMVIGGTAIGVGAALVRGGGQGKDEKGMET